MKLTKYEHACFTIEHDGKILIVDPGVYTSNLNTPENVSGVVVTHEHADHFDSSALGAIIAHNPDAVIIGPPSVTKQIEGALPTQTVHGGDTVHLESFQLRFFGDTHATIHESIPIIANVGVLINDTVFYPGDNFTTPGVEVDTLALPVAAPWLKISEVIDYIETIQPRFIFPTHDAILSDKGKVLVDQILSPFAEKSDAHYQRIDGKIISVDRTDQNI